MTNNSSHKRVAIVPGEGLPSVPDALKILARLDDEIENADTFVDLNIIAGTARGWQRVFERVSEVSNRAGLVWINAERKLAEKLAEQPKATGGQPYQSTGSKTEPVDRPSTLAEKGVDKKRAARAKKLAEIAEAIAADGKAVSPTTILSAVRSEVKRDKIHAVSVAAFSEDGPFGVVVIDPPWKMQKIDRDVRPNQDAFDYPTMTEDEIEKFWRDEMPDRLEPDCHLFMWTTQKHWPAAMRLVDSFGFNYVLTMVWHKSGGFQPIGLPQYNCEFVVYARKGAPVFVDTKDFDCCFSAPRREHSRKPDFFYDTIRRVTGGSRVDVFSREPRDGFAQFGNEIEKFAGAA